MPLNKRNTKVFHRTLYAGELESVTCLKRDDDQREGTVRAVKLFSARWSLITKSGQPLQGDMSAQHYRTLHLPRVEMDRTGISHFNVLDRFVDEQGRTWQPESPQQLKRKLFENHQCIDCRRCDPPVV